jgi:Gpi18-like mannosyltransferase
MASLLVRLALVPVLMNRPDRRDYIGSAQKLVRFGLANFYGSTSGDRANRQAPVPYPPIPVYFYALAGYIYQGIDPDFREIEKWRDVPTDSLILNYLIEIPVFLFELLLTIAIFWFVRPRLGDQKAIVCAGLYALNPAILYDGAMWAQPDAIHCFFLTLAVIWLIERKVMLCLTMLTLALLSKPQPIALVPILLILAFSTASVRQSVRAVLAACATAVVVLLPFLVQKPQSILDMLKTISQAHHFVSLNAHNFWWLVTSFEGVDPRWLADNEPLFWGMTYFAVAMFIFAGIYSATVMKTLRMARNGLSSEPLAYLGLAFFVFAVRMHENHLIQVLPLLLLTGLTLRHQRVIFAGVSLAVLANLILHSKELTGAEASPLIQHLRIVNAVLNLSLFFYWSYYFFKGSWKEIARFRVRSEPLSS